MSSNGNFTYCVGVKRRMYVTMKLNTNMYGIWPTGRPSTTLLFVHTFDVSSYSAFHSPFPIFSHSLWTMKPLPLLQVLLFLLSPPVSCVSSLTEVLAIVVQWNHELGSFGSPAWQLALRRFKIVFLAFQWKQRRTTLQAGLSTKQSN